MSARVHQNAQHDSAQKALQKERVMVSGLEVNQRNQPIKRTTTQKKITARLKEIKELMTEQGDFLRPLIGLVLQEVLEAEMSEKLGAEKGERTEGRLTL